MLVGSGHMVPPHAAQLWSAHVSFVHHAAQPGRAAVAVVHLGLLHCAQASTPQCASVHHAAQPSTLGVHLGLLQLSQP